jgi:hypothetical protein
MPVLGVTAAEFGVPVQLLAMLINNTYDVTQVVSGKDFWGSSKSLLINGYLNLDHIATQ